MSADSIDALVAKLPSSSLSLRVNVRATDAPHDEWLTVSNRRHVRGSSLWHEWNWSSGAFLDDGRLHEHTRSRAQASFAACVAAAAAAFAAHTLRPETLVVDWSARGRKAKKLDVDAEVRAPAAQLLCEAFGLASPVAASRAPELPKVGAVKDDGFEDAYGIVSVWANANLGDADDEDDDVGLTDRNTWLDIQDRWESCAADSLEGLSCARTFAAAVRRRAKELGVRLEQIDVLFDTRVRAVPGRRSDGWLLGSFPYERVDGRAQLTPAPGMVSIWIDTVLDPKGGLDGAGGPVGWFDHDDWEASAGAPEAVLPLLSKAAHFASAAIAQVRALGLEHGTRVDALYGVAYAATPGKLATGAGWFIGTFPCVEGKPSVG